MNINLDSGEEDLITKLDKPLHKNKKCDTGKRRLGGQCVYRPKKISI